MHLFDSDHKAKCLSYETKTIEVPKKEEATCETRKQRIRAASVGKHSKAAVVQECW